ncbi:hypothetical protein [Streptomyces sp. NPDC050564]|uniref:hypothetical protein n=1 Tax=Streptomyces sp. NPDC050564 TaxID=3365631 RepID=UPI0037959430
MWDSSACVDGHGQRWIKITRTSPAAVDFSWDSIPNSTGCEQKTHAPGGTYLVEAEVFQNKAQASFVLLSDSGTNGGDLFGGPTG